MQRPDVNAAADEFKAIADAAQKQTVIGENGRAYDGQDALFILVGRLAEQLHKMIVLDD